MSSVYPRLLGYTTTASWFHWCAGIPMVGTIATVLKAQQSPKDQKGKWMHRHKSLGLLTGMVVAPRFAYRLFSQTYKVQPLAGNSALENSVGKFSHYVLYGFMTIMPATGIAMGYYGGKGLPFFGTSFAGVKINPNLSDDAAAAKKKKNGAIAKRSFQFHKQIGTYGKYLVPIHVGASFFHMFRGQKIFTRINPFRQARG